MELDMTLIPNDEIFGGLKETPEQFARDYHKGYEAGKAAGSKIAAGELFRGAMGYADHYAGSNRACRLTGAWKGACAGYLDGLPAHKSIVVDANGLIVRVE